MVDGARRALRFLFEPEQYQLEQALREELSNTQVSYLMHFSSLWEDSGEASSAAISLDIPDLTNVEHRRGRTRAQCKGSRPAGLRGAMPIMLLAVPVTQTQRLAAQTLLLLQLPVGASGLMCRTMGTFPSLVFGVRAGCRDPRTGRAAS